MGLHEVHIVRRRTLPGRVVEVTVSRPDGFAFRPGQYVQIEVPRLMAPDHRGRSRVFSLVSAVEDPELTFAFRQTGSGFKQSLESMADGGSLRLEGPHGHTTFPDGLSAPLVMVAGGIGITGFLSMLKKARALHHQHPVTVICVNRNRAEAPYSTELDSMTSMRSITVVTTNRQALAKALESEFQRYGNELLWLVSGPPTMVAETHHRLSGFHGIAEHRILGDAFNGYD